MPSSHDGSSVKSGKFDEKALNEDVTVLVDNVSLDFEHRNVGGAPIEDVSPIGLEVGWWTAVLLSKSCSP